MGENNLECVAKHRGKLLDRRLRILKSSVTKKPPLLAKDARNGGSDQVDGKPKQLECHPVLLESCHSFQASIFGEPACIAQAGKGSVLIDTKNADGAGT